MKKRIISILLVLSILLPLSARPKIALVLSGGGARGFMHVPVIQALEERGIYPDIVVGTSMGGLVGGLYASGYTGDELAKFILSKDFFTTVFSLTQPFYTDTHRAYDLFDRNIISLEYGSEGVGQVNSLLSDVRINAMLRSALVKTIDIDDFDELSIPFRTVGTDFKTGEKIVFSSGSLFDALRSTMSMPIVFPPYVISDGRMVVDGGVVDNFPVDIALEMGADIIIGVDVNEGVRLKAESTDSLDTLSGVVSQYMILTSQTYVIQQYDEVDYLIVPPTEDISVVGFADTKAILDKGYEFTRENAALFDAIAKELAEYLPLERPTPLYSEREYSYISSFSLPPEIENKYGDVIRDFSGSVYDDEFISAFDTLLESIRKRENLKSLTYSIQNGVVTVNSERYISMQSAFFLGLKGGAFTSYSNDRGFYFGFDPSLSVSTVMDFGSLQLDVGIKAGAQNIVSADISLPVLSNFFFNTSLYGGYGGFSAVSGHYMKGKYTSGDWGFGLSAGFSYNPSGMHSLNLDFMFDSYLLSGEKRYGTEEMMFFSDNDHYIPSFVLSYHYNNLAPDPESSPFYIDYQLEAKAGYEKGWLYSFRSSLSGFAHIRGNSYFDFSADLFTSRYPYELISSYRQDYLGTVSRDAIYADAGYRYNLTRVFDGLFVGGGVFLLADDGDGIAFREDGLLLPADDISMIPFASLSLIRGGVTLSFGHFSDFGTIELLLRISSAGEGALIFRIR